MKNLRGSRVLVTGLTGFTGVHLRRELESAGAIVEGLEFPSPDGREDRIDLIDRDAVQRALSGRQFERVVHLAGVSFAADRNVSRMMAVNVVGTRNLLEALSSMESCPELVVVASSAAVYGSHDASPIRENCEPRPNSDYGIGKLATEGMCRMFGDRLPILVARPFNYTGVGQSLDFIVPKLVDNCVRRNFPIPIGNIDVAREFNDVRDVVHTYRRLLEVGRAGDTINIASSRALLLRDMVTLLESLTGHSIPLSVDNALLRRSDSPVLRGSSDRLCDRVEPIEWRPLEATLQWMLDDAGARLAGVELSAK